MPGDPPDIGRRPEDIGFRFYIEYGPVGIGGTHQIPAGSVHNAFGFTGRPRGVHDVQRVLGIKELQLMGFGLPVDQLMPPNVALIVPVDLLAGALDDHHIADLGQVLQSFIDGGLQRVRFAPPVAAVGGDDDFNPAVFDAIGDGSIRESPENHGVRGADARTR